MGNAAETPTYPVDPLLQMQSLERRLGGVQKVLNHDLSNLLVVIQGLAQLLVLEERERLGEEGRDYLKRLQGAAERALTMIQGLKKLARVGTDHEKIQPLSLEVLVRDLDFAMKELFPRVNLASRPGPDAGTVWARPSSLNQALLELARMIIREGGGPVLELHSRRCGDEVELWLACSGNLLSEKGCKVSELDRFSDSRVELLLIGALAEVWGGHLKVYEEPGRNRIFSLVIAGNRSQGSGAKS